MKEDKLISLLQKKRGFFEAILELSTLQKNISIQEWISILEQKKTLVTCIEAVDEELKVFSSQFSTLPQDVHEELDAIRSLVNEIKILDQNHIAKRKRDLLGTKELDGT